LDGTASYLPRTNTVSFLSCSHIAFILTLILGHVHTFIIKTPRVPRHLIRVKVRVRVRVRVRFRVD
jgi:hypothetical protein